MFMAVFEFHSVHSKTCTCRYFNVRTYQLKKPISYLFAHTCFLVEKLTLPGPFFSGSSFIGPVLPKMPFFPLPYSSHDNWRTAGAAVATGPFRAIFVLVGSLQRQHRQRGGFHPQHGRHISAQSGARHCHSQNVRQSAPAGLDTMTSSIGSAGTRGRQTEYIHALRLQLRCGSMYILHRGATARPTT